ncbi:hypothetical protein V9T40_014102 [Parthenolecanium corni]|uniref:C2H2-type domain-containing protein n=1 Tax=Parthenolecanium corni TaxID=536013 RepID=A0AAN9Y1X1_9HEMI
MDDSNDSDCELVIDETIILSDDEEKTEGMMVQNMTEEDWDIFHPVSISSSDMKEELFNDETNTCNICNETFRYNIGLICHLQMDHVELKIQSKVGKEKKQKKRSTKATSNAISKVVYRKAETNLTKKFACDVCKKPFMDQSKLLKHSETCSTKFSCVYCKSKFSWESKYKKHLYKIHKFNAVVICKLCSSVFGDMNALANHSLSCEPKSSQNSSAVKPLSQVR